MVLEKLIITVMKAVMIGISNSDAKYIWLCCSKSQWEFLHIPFILTGTPSHQSMDFP